MRNSNFNLIKSLGYVVVLVSMASHSVPHEYWQNTEDGLLYGHVGDSEEEHKLGKFSIEVQKFEGFQAL